MVQGILLVQLKLALIMGLFILRILSRETMRVKLKGDTLHDRLRIRIIPDRRANGCEDMKKELDQNKDIHLLI